ncbi:response regulator [Acidisoma silvae]|uniref:Response regulator n=2 Tax=Acidisoma silvae TaxID=2802396 RepID=A0A963YWS0_9PROT|nr:response regulator [Acidisoma silvae]
MHSRNTVVIVDDSVESLNFLTDVLESAGLTVLVALSGESAMLLVDKVVPDLILMDAMMPGMDGFETCRRLKASASFVDLPIIFMTGLSETEHIIRGFQACGVDYVTKPVVPNELLARIERHLATAQTARNARTAIDLTGRFLIAVDANANVVWSTPQANRLVMNCLGASDSALQDLPSGLSGWLSKPLESSASAITVQMGSRSVQATYIGRVSENEIILRLSLDDQQADKEKLQKKFRLTVREADVLLWISAGKTNKDIGEILGLSPRTVNKYLDQIFEKMSVENRAAAAAHAVRVLSGI